jgi:hypothetical protein
MRLLFLSQLTWITWALRLNQNIMWCIRHDSTAYLYSRSKVDYISTTWASQSVPSRALIKLYLRGATNSIPFLWAHLPRANDLNLHLWIKSISSSNHHLHKAIYERLILTNMNTIYDQDSLSHPVLERNRMHLICAPGSSSTHMIDDTSVYSKQYHNEIEYYSTLLHAWPKVLILGE